MDLKLRATIPLILQFEIILAMWRAAEAERIRIYLDDHESLLVPKSHAELNTLNPVVYVSLPKINKKPLKYLKHIPTFSNFRPGPDLAGGNKEVSLEELIRPISLPSYRPVQHAEQYQNFEDIKPVMEIIEGDLKYDFRTKTHSFR